MNADRSRVAGLAGSRAFRRGVATLGVFNVLTYLLYVALSYGMAVVVPFTEPQPREAAAYDRLADALAPLGAGAQAFVRGDSFLAERGTLFGVYSLFPIVLGVSFLLLLRLIARHREALDDRAATAIARWAIVFAIVLVAAAPVLVQDFWLSPAWGRLIARGVNPYVVATTGASATGLPLDDLGLRFTYGPLWAILSGLVMLPAGTSVLAAAVLFKLLLASAWIGSVLLVSELLRRQGAVRRCLGIAIFGWVPLGVMQAVGDGHNGVVMVVFALLWLRMLQRNRPRPASVALVASVLVKYVTAPLLLLDVLHLYRSRGRPFRAYLPQALSSAAIVVCCFAIFFRSFDQFGATAGMAGWHFYTPRDAVIALGRLAGIAPGFQSLAGLLVIGLAVMVQGAFVLVGVAAILHYWRAPSTERFHGAVAGMIFALLFGVIGHLWPWYLVLGLAGAAMDDTSARVRWVVGYSLVAVFPLLYWVVVGGPAHFTQSTPLLFGAAVLLFVFLPRTWFGSNDPRPTPVIVPASIRAGT